MKTLITTIALFIMTLSSSVFGQDKEFTYSKTNLVWDFISKDNLHLKMYEDGAFILEEAGGTWNSTKDATGFKVTFEDYYGNIT
jgi:hypothetical protein